MCHAAAEVLCVSSTHWIFVRQQESLSTKCTSVQSIGHGDNYRPTWECSVWALRLYCVRSPSSLHRRTAMSEIPPEISTGHLLLRGLIPSFVGCAIGDDGSGVGAVRASAFQMTFRKELPQLGRAGGELLPPGSRCVLSRCILMCLCDVWAQLSV